MSRSEAELTLVMRAKNLADSEVNDLSDSLEGVAGKAQRIADKFKGLGPSIRRGIGNIAEDIIRGQPIESVFAEAGVLAASSMIVAFGDELLMKIATSGPFTKLVGIVTPALAAAGTTMGGIIAAAIPIGMAALPFLLIGALIAAIGFLILNPDLQKQIYKVGENIARWLVDKLVGIVTWFLALPGKLVGIGAEIVGTLVRGMIDLPRKIADVVREAFSNLKIDVGPFHIRASGVTIDLPDITQSADGKWAGATMKGHAAGGWVGLHGPEIGLLGEKGPEYVVPNGGGTGGGGGGFSIKGVSEREILDMVDRGLYFKLQRAAPTVQRS